MTNYWTNDSWSQQHTNTGWNSWQQPQPWTTMDHHNQWTDHTAANAAVNPFDRNYEPWQDRAPCREQYVQEGKGKPSDNKGYYDKGYKGEAKGKAKGDDKGKAKGDDKGKAKGDDKGKAYPAPEKGAPGLAKGEAKGKRARWTCSSCGRYNSTNGEWTDECNCTAEAKAAGKGKSSAKDGKGQSTEWQNDNKGPSKSAGKGKTIDEFGNAHRYIPDAKGNPVYTRVYHARVQHASGRPKFDRDVRHYLVGTEATVS